MVKRFISQTTLPSENHQSAPLNLSGVSSILGVSTTTVRNWVKAGQLRIRIPNGRLQFDADHIQEIKKMLVSGEFRKLYKRANKKQSRLTFIPDEYSANEGIMRAVTALVSHFRNNNYNLRPFMRSVIFKLLPKEQTETIQREMVWWSRDSSEITPHMEIDIPQGNCDFLGLLYQSLLLEGKKSETGAYYTPSKVAEAMITENLEPKSLFLDPCCGTGLFLIQAAKLISNPEHIWGYDLDEYAVRIARLNLILQFPNFEFTPNIFCRNGLHEPKPRFDVVATNPPWGVHFSNEELNELRTTYKTCSNESFAFFIQAGLRHLKENGRLSVLLPDSFLNIKAHQNIRRLILEDTCIEKTSNLGRIFKNVFTPVIRLDVRNKPPPDEHKFIGDSRAGICSLSQKRIKENNGYIFDILSTSDDHFIIDHLYACEHARLKGHSDWALGIVTGNNSSFLSDKASTETEPILLGKDVRLFVARAPQRYIHFAPERFQQVAPTFKYRAAEKLLYRFISKDLVFSYDNHQMLALNSANILIPRLSEYPIKACLALLNSTVFQFLFQKQFKTVKVLRGDLERLPFPFMSKSLKNDLCKSVDILTKPGTTHAAWNAIYKDINQMIMDAFHLNDLQKAHLEKAVSLAPSCLPFRV